jgi:hypothetical protein
MIPADVATEIKRLADEAGDACGAMSHAAAALTVLDGYLFQTGDPEPVRGLVVVVAEYLEAHGHIALTTQAALLRIVENDEAPSARK